MNGLNSITVPTVWGPNRLVISVHVHAVDDTVDVVADVATVSYRVRARLRPLENDSRRELFRENISTTQPNRHQMRPFTR